VSGVRLENISSSYADVSVLKNINLKIDEGNFLTILGASGSGKTTCLRIVAGLVRPSAGRVFIGNSDVTSTPPYRRDTGMVFQNYALFPHMTVAENVAYGLSVRGLPKADVYKQTQEALRLVHLDDLAKRYPKQLSGGQKQRVALARAVTIKPKVLLLDEPLGALDLKLREELQVEIRRVQQTLGITTLSVTHDQGEALSMSDKVVVMRDGQILQVDTPVALYEAPNSAFVARFIGRMNLLGARVESRDSAGNSYAITHSGAGAEKLAVVTARGEAFIPGENCLVVFRPEDARFGTQLANQIHALVERVTYHGNGWTITCAVPGGESISINLQPGGRVPEPKETVTVCWAAERCLLLKADKRPDGDASR
jgi:putative spermidine/putrescine transport system ATP-binding protein